ncbi:HupE/UreJ family protein [Phenylobacterium sp. LjRoot225]|uniref:HupE/UreJ family protein n=1 Tax=Phenylobacterium sp. LjRoot225 TaxID=3342285 RepID=UPI003ECF8CF0
MTRLLRRLSAAAALAALAATPALAHPGHPGHEDLGAWAGFGHPFTGLDHMLAMLAVGLWATRRGGRALATWPATFLFAMAAGFVLPVFDRAALELGVLASVILLGAVTALNRRAGEAAGLVVVGAAGVLHGMAHAADIGRADPTFELGMLLATGALIAAGLGLGLGLALRRGELVRWLGAGVAACGVVLAVAG